jgi:23S rRNA pseudouridine1911/1915/1917 synthase
MKPAPSQTYHVAPDQAQQTLVGVLRRCRPGDSWSQVRQLLQSRRVMVNGNLCLDEGRRLKPGDVVKVMEAPLAAPPKSEDIKIRYLDAHLAIIEKPAGMTTMRHAEERFWPARRKQLQPTLDETLPRVIERYETKGKGPKKKGRPPRVRAVHRLDRETSGLMVFARTPVAETHLVQQFRKHTIHRRYLAIVQGRIEAQTIESNLVLDRGDGRRGSTQLPDVGKRAVTHVRPIEFLDGYTLVECTLETGRTHQIRIHLSEQGHPVCGDKMYSQPLFEKPIVDRSGAPRVALHAAELGLVHPVTGEQLDFKMPFPPDLVEFVNRLRKQKAKPPAK